MEINNANVVGNLTVGNDTINNFETFGKHNAVLNGAMNIAQRGTSVPINSAVLYGLDGWKSFKTATAQFNMNQYSGGPTFAQSGYKSVHSLEMDVTTAQADLGTTSYEILSHPIEGLRLSPFIGNVVTLSFWLMATKTGTTCVKVIGYGDGKEILKEFTISQSLTWEKHTWTFELDPSMTFNQDETAGLGINFSLGAGTNYQGAATEVWTDFVYQCTSNQVNHMDNTNNVFRLSQVQLELGEEATPYKDIDPALEKMQCQRYFQKTASNSVHLEWLQTLNSAALYKSEMFPVTMRATPTMTFFDSLGASGKVSYYSEGASVNGISPVGSTATVDGFFVLTSGLTNANGLFFGWQADASM